MSKKWVYVFSKEKTEGNRNDKNLLGGKGANLAEMTAMGVPVPPGFTVSTEACLNYYDAGEKITDEIKDQAKELIAFIEKNSGKKFGDVNNPLLFSVRSGARVSMPGMMDTVLNLGLNDEVVEGLATKFDARFAWDSYRRFIQMYSNVVLNMDGEVLEHKLSELKAAKKVTIDTELTADDLKELVATYKATVKEATGELFPNEPIEQLWKAIGAVFASWNNERAMIYRQMHGYSHDWGTAVNIQSMVYGNMGDDCATGVCFTRDPSTGDNRFFGDYTVDNLQVAVNIVHPTAPAGLIS